MTAPRAHRVVERKDGGVLVRLPPGRRPDSAFRSTMPLGCQSRSTSVALPSLFPHDRPSLRLLADRSTRTNTFVTFPDDHRGRAAGKGARHAKARIASG